MEREKAIDMATELVKRSEIVMLGTNGSDGYPNVKAMLNVEAEGLNSFWLSTNTSSKRVKQLLEDKRACLYFVDQESFIGLMLVGDIEVRQDEAARKRLWSDGDERYYSLGVSDPDYSVLHFKATRGNLYHGLDNVNFELGE